MAEREHFTNFRCFTFGTGFALVATAFGAQIGSWTHWITIGIGYGMGIVLMLIATALITKSYFSGESEHLATARELPVQSPPRLKIISANWGIEGVNDPDVTSCLLERLHGNAFAEPVVLVLFHGKDPVSGNPNKRLKVRYSFDGREATITRPENAWLILPEDKFLSEQVSTLKNELQQVKAERFSLSVNDHLIAGPLAHTEDRARQEALKRPIGNILKPLQMEAIELANDLRAFVDSVEPVPVVDRSRFERDIEAHLKEVHIVIDPWCDGVRADYELRFQGKVDEMRRRFTVEHILSDSLKVEVHGREVKRVVEAIASELWVLASKVGVKEDVDEKNIGIPGRY